MNPCTYLVPRSQHIQHPSHGLCGSAGLNAYSRSLLWRAILTRKVGHTDLVFGVGRRLISRFVHAEFTICAILVVAKLDFFTFLSFDPCDPKK